MACLALFHWSFADTLHFNLIPREVVESRLGQYKGDDKQRESTLKEMFAEAGCSGQNLPEQGIKGSKQPNVVCMLPGNSGRTIIVGAHFDHVSAADGVVDNWSGASLLPSLYEAVKVEPRKHSYIFIGFTDEEQGEVGSHFYAQHMTQEAIAATDAMANMDTLGLGPAEVWASHSDKQLTNALAYLGKLMNQPVRGVNVEQIGSTDSEQFAARKVPSITIHSLTQQTWNARILDTHRDKTSEMQLDRYYESYRLIAALSHISGSVTAGLGGKSALSTHQAWRSNLG